MATSRFNWAALLGIDEELIQRFGKSFSISSQNNNRSNQRHTINSYMNNCSEDDDEMDRVNSYDEQYQDDEDSREENLTEFAERYSLEGESDPKRYTKKKLIKKKKTHLEKEKLSLPVTKTKELTIEAKSMPANSFYRTNKQQLRDAILWAEVLGEPKCKKRHRK